LWKSNKTELRAIRTIKTDNNRINDRVRNSRATEIMGVSVKTGPSNRSIERNKETEVQNRSTHNNKVVLTGKTDEPVGRDEGNRYGTKHRLETQKGVRIRKKARAPV